MTPDSLATLNLSQLRCDHHDCSETKNLIWSMLSKDIMQIEDNLYDADLRETSKEYEKTFKDKNSLFILLHHKKLGVAGYICGGPLSNYINRKDVEWLSTYKPDECFYIETINVDKKFQRRGLGTYLFKFLLKECKLKGYKHVFGHFCEESSILAYKFKGKNVLRMNDYCCSGRTFNYIKIDL